MVSKSEHFDFKYDTPPVTEVVASVQFADIANLSAIHFGTIWEKFKLEGFTEFQEQMPLPKIPTEGLQSYVFNTAPFLPRVWFINPKESTLIQFQRDRFCLNWRRGGKDYPGYETVIASFASQYEILLSILSELKLPTPQSEILELTYINVIPVSEFGSLENIHTVLTDVNWHPKENLPVPANVQINYQFNLLDDTALSVSISTAQRIDNKEKVLHLEQRAIKRYNAHQAINFMPVFEKLHDALTYGFEDLLKDTIKNKWGRKHA